MEPLPPLRPFAGLADATTTAASPGAEPYPLWIKPDEKLAVADVFDLMRDHYEGTDFDMTQGVDAGPYGTPNRWRPMGWEVDGEHYTWERPISTQQTGFSMVTQSRGWLPDPVGGLTWYGVDDTWFTCYVPLYCGIDAVPPSLRHRQPEASSRWDSAWWVFNFVSNYADLKYSYMIEDIQAVQAEARGRLPGPAAGRREDRRRAGRRPTPTLMPRYLTDYSVQHAEAVVRQVARPGRVPADQVQRRLREGRERPAPGSGLSRSVAAFGVGCSAGAVQIA